MASLWFGPEGPLADALRARGMDPAPRPAQQAYARHLTECLAAGRPAFIDTETGVGKTLGYLVPMLNHAWRGAQVRPVVVISTANVALQRQIMDADLPVALDAFARATGRRLRAAMRVGRRQVIDPEALETAVTDLGTAGDRLLADDMIGWCETALARGELPMRSALLSAFSDRLSAPHPWLSADLIGLTPESDAAGALFQRLMDECAEADVLVVNHHLLARHLIRPFLWDGERVAHVVVDEADRLPQIVEDMTRSAVPLHRLHSLAGGRADTAIAEAITRLDAVLSPRWGNREVIPLNSLTQPEQGVVLGVIRDLRGQIAHLTRDPPAALCDDIAALDTYGIALERILRRAEQGDLARTVICHSPVRRYPGIATIAEGAARIIAKRLWSEPAAPVGGLLFTSATLSTLAQGEDTDARRAMAGFIAGCGFAAEKVDAACCAQIAPERFGTLRFVRPALAAPAAFAPGGDADTAQVAEAALRYWKAMIEAASRAGGRCLVLLPATRDVLAMSRLFTPDDPRLVAQLPGLPMNLAIARFLAKPDAVWLSASAWEGVSLPHAIAHVVIPRFPIRPQSFEDTVLQRYLAQVTGGERAGRATIFGRRLAEARRRLRQGIGRGIRAQDDSVTIWIGDPRWPLNQQEADMLLLDQPRPWSGAMLNAVPGRFRKVASAAPRFQAGAGWLQSHPEQAMVPGRSSPGLWVGVENGGVMNIITKQSSPASGPGSTEAGPPGLPSAAQAGRGT
ncbi:helicase C-terminal domain-containing protein [Paenirhodobacter sp.]|uniref:helicase C-terminal domain-containing protein n=1 Tax=Paenirhodobacter sp. TaxID=1965326 RepID=UPI003B3D267C